jgi:glutamyl-tRNA synthetase
MDITTDIITRFAPSPTGLMHFGSARAAILPFLFARHNEGCFSLRIDDTDVQRSKKEFVQEIFIDMEWLGLKYDYVLYQSERNEIYDKYFEDLSHKGAIYPCYDSPEEIESIREIKRYSKKAPIYSFEDRKHTDGSSPHWRFKLSNEINYFKDMIFGELKFNKEWSDPVVKRADGTYCYVFCSVVDDIVQSVSHIIRGAEHISNAAVQQQIGNAIIGDKWNIVWAHFPMLLSTEGSKLSKRDESLSLKSLREDSLESLTLISFLMELGSSNKKIISSNLQDYIDAFHLEKFSKVPKKFFEKELWERNKLIFRNLSPETVVKRNIDLKTWNLLKYNCARWSEIEEAFNNLKSFQRSGRVPGIGKQFYRDVFGKESGPPINEVLDYLQNS